MITMFILGAIHFIILFITLFMTLLMIVRMINKRPIHIWPIVFVAFMWTCVILWVL